MTNDQLKARAGPSNSSSAGLAKVREKISIERLKICLLIILAVAHVLVSWFVVSPGYLLVDEAFTHWMVRDFSATGGLEIWNGYSEFPSKELSHRHVPVHSRRLVPQWPYLFPVICLPFYWLWGFFGIFLVNSLSFMGVVFLCLVVARRLFRDLNLALNSCFILILATFAWEYSQAAWPHATALLLIIAVFYFGLRAYFAEHRSEALLWAFCAGLIAGFAPGVRMDCFLAVPGIILPFLFARPCRPLEALFIGLGAAPGLIALAATNFIKFGVFSPFSYGHKHGIGVSYYLIGAGAILVLVIWGLTRPYFDEFTRKRKRLLIAVVAALAIGIVLVPQGGSLLKRTLADGYVSVVDVRALDRGARMPSLERSSGGGMIYIGAHKKSLLQSLPFLAGLFILPFAIARRKEDRAGICLLMIIPVSFLAYYSFARHEFGGLSLNFRYFLPVLPFASILSAYSVREMRREWGLVPGVPAIVCIVVLTAVAHFVFTTSAITLDDLEFPLLVVPLIMAGSLVFLVTAGLLVKTEGSRGIRGAAWVVLVAAITWAGMTAFFYDYPRHHHARKFNHWIGEELLSLVANDSLFFSDPYMSPNLLEKTRVRIAFPRMDRGKDFPKLVAYHLKEGRRVFAVFNEGLWEKLKRGPLAPYKITPLGSIPGALMAEISLEPRPGDSIPRPEPR